MSKRLDGRVALVTGSSRGIGRAIALAFAKEGAKVCINYLRSKDKAEEVVDMIKSIGGEAIMVKADVSDDKEVKHMISTVVEDFGGLDILVNNAAILQRDSLLNVDYEGFQRMMDVNVKGVLLCSQEAAKHMIPKRYGKIVNIASIAGIGTAFKDLLSYSISKAAVILATKKLALELGQYNINVNAIAPGLVLTDMLQAGLTREEFQKVIEYAKQHSVLRRVCRPEDIAKVALFLASDESDLITGQVLVVDAGRTDYLSHSL